MALDYFQGSFQVWRQGSWVSLPALGPPSPQNTLTCPGHLHILAQGCRDRTTPSACRPPTLGTQLSSGPQGAGSLQPSRAGVRLLAAPGGSRWRLPCGPASACLDLLPRAVCGRRLSFLFDCDSQWEMCTCTCTPAHTAPAHLRTPRHTAPAHPHAWLWVDSVCLEFLGADTPPVSGHSPGLLGVSGVGAGSLALPVGPGLCRGGVSWSFLTNRAGSLYSRDTHASP